MSCVITEKIANGFLGEAVIVCVRPNCIERQVAV